MESLAEIDTNLELLKAARLAEQIELERLRAINADLLAALEAIHKRSQEPGSANYDVWEIASVAIAKALG